MNKFSIILVSLAASAGLAVAQQKPADPKAPAGAGSAAAPKAAATGAATGSAAAPAAPPTVEVPKPPAAIKDTIKMMGARQNCTGVTWGGPDGKSEVKAKGTTTNALALDSWWIKGASNMTMGEGKAKMTMKMDSYMTWDGKAGLWRQVVMGNDGSLMVGTATMKDGKFESQSDMFGGMMGAGKWRERGDMTDPKAGIKFAGEMSMDNGKTWTKVYEMTCKK